MHIARLIRWNNDEPNDIVKSKIGSNTSILNPFFVR
jgi:hypothetical protein